MLTPNKGKPSSFFRMTQDMANCNSDNPHGYTLNDEQWKFVLQNYPEYSKSPFELMFWLLVKAQDNESNSTDKDENSNSHSIFSEKT